MSEKHRAGDVTPADEVPARAERAARHAKLINERAKTREYSRRMKSRDGSVTIALDPMGQDVIRHQLAAFEEKFGRPPGPDEPIFFDPAADTPQPFPEDDYFEVVDEMWDDLGLDPALLAAWKELGYIVTEMNQQTFSLAEIEAFEAAAERHQVRRSGSPFFRS
jgi:hypothetical protein